MHPFIAHLVKDHVKQRKLARSLKQSQSIEERKRLLDELSAELLPHMAGEEASIFSYMHGFGSQSVTQQALEAIQEHHIAKLVLGELQNLSLDGEVFSAKAAVLFELNEHHMQEEEVRHFPWLESHASTEDIDGLFESYEVAEAVAS